MSLPAIGVARAGVVGAGTMGAGIAQALAQAGAAVHVVDVDAAGVERGLERARRDLAHGVSRGRWTDADARAAAARLTGGGGPPPPPPPAPGPRAGPPGPPPPPARL